MTAAARPSPRELRARPLIDVPCEIVHPGDDGMRVSVIVFDAAHILEILDHRSDAVVVLGRQPDGVAVGDERWVSVLRDDDQLVVGGHAGWAQTATATLSGWDPVAGAELLATVVRSFLVTP